MPVVSLLILAFAVSLDGFGVGAMYGLRKIKLPLLPLIIISVCSGLVILVSMKIGVSVAALFSPEFARNLGAFILVGIGIWAVVQMMLQREQPDHRDESARDEQPAATERKTVFSFELKRAGIVIQILRSPAEADVDRSGIISPAEAGLLGLALSLDAFGAGIGAALIGFSPLLTAVMISASSGIFIAAGLRVGFRCADLDWFRRLSILPGFILIAIGLFKLL